MRRPLGIRGGCTSLFLATLLVLSLLVHSTSAQGQNGLERVWSGLKQIWHAPPITDPMELAALIAKKKVEDPEAVARLGEELAQAIAFTSREAKQRGKLATLKSFWAKQGVAVGQRSVQPDGDAHSAVVISTPTSTQVLPYHSAAQVPVHRTGSQLQEDIHDLGDVLENLNDAELARKLELYRYTLRHLYHRDMDKMSAHEFMEFVNDWEARGFWHSPEGRAVKEQWESLSQPGGAAGSRTWDEDAGYWAHGGPGASSGRFGGYATDPADSIDRDIRPRPLSWPRGAERGRGERRASSRSNRSYR